MIVSIFTEMITLFWADYPLEEKSGFFSASIWIISHTILFVVFEFGPSHPKKISDKHNWMTI